ncbi:DUF6781 family protein [Holophaga foetida]|uniref:DUF6781 family protein n=1 Tax=Holophaga foetida TaxID=35839 RepID=UPI0002472EDF|nr:DUF6781 family protein [Holophaga foetida]
MTQQETDRDTKDLEGRIRDAIERGEDIQELVRQLTLRRMSDFTQDLASLRSIAGAVIRGARAGIEKDLDQSRAQTELARQRLGSAIEGLDAALAQFALASKLALEEATSHAKQVPGEDLARLREELESLDTMFFETLENTAATGRHSAGAILKDLASHLRTQGSAVGTQAHEALSALAHQAGATGEAQAKVGLHLAQGTVGLLRQLTAGALTGLADHIQPKRKQD